MKAPPSRPFVLTTIACVLIASGCKDCPACTSLEVDLSPLPLDTQQPVVAVFQQAGGSSVNCEWKRIDAGHDPSWNCAKDADPETSSQGQFFFDLSNPSRSWRLSLTGPSGTASFDVSPSMYDPDPEAWPGTCTCDGFKLELTPEQLARVGVRTVTSDSTDAGTDAG